MDRPNILDKIELMMREMEDEWDAEKGRGMCGILNVLGCYHDSKGEVKVCIKLTRI